MMRYKIDKLVQLIMDYRGKTPKKLGMNWTENQCDIVALSAKNIKDNKIVNTDKSHYGSESLYKRWMKDGDIEPGDILITSEAPLGEVYLITKPIKAILSQRLFLLRFNKNIVNPWYIFAFMNSQSFKNKLFSKATGTTVVGIKQKELRKIEIDLPNIRLQNKVGDIFRVIYKKIIINEIINDNLLELISSIWKKQSSDIHNKITLKRLAKRIITGKTPSTKIKENYGIDIPFVKIPDMHNKIFIDETSQKLSIFGANSQKNKYVPKNSIIVSCIGTPGLVSLIGRTVQTNQQINSLILDNKYIYCTYLELKSLKYKIRNLGSGGTTIQNLNKTNFGNIKITVPNKDSQLDNFNGIAKPIFERIHVNNIELQNLVKIKEVLLGQYF
ncbi:restriction endonuclease subunit S [Lactobacillus sp. W8086]|nr:restriction endonuclease subunit S [Lactobacillus sp. W8086]